MRRTTFVGALVALFCFGSSLAAQPFIFYRGVLNGASFVPQGLPNGSIARGSIFSIFGRELGPAEGMTVSSFPLGINFQGVSIEVCQAGNCVQAIPLFVLNSQINAIMPSNAPLGEVSVRVTYNGTAGNFSPATVVASSFGAFAINAGGFGPGIVQNFTPAESPINSTVTTAMPGQTVIAWGTGLGAGLNADNVAPQPGDLPVPVEIWVGGKAVAVKRYSGRSPCCAGVDQIVFDLPPDVPTGCYVPVFVRAGDVVSNATTLAIGEGGTCADPGNAAAAALRAGGAIGRITFASVSRLLRQGSIELTNERLDAVFGSEPGGVWAFNPDISDPPLGSCTVIQSRGSSAVAEPPGTAPGLDGLDAGAELRLNAGQEERVLPPQSEGTFSSVVGQRIVPSESPSSLLLADGGEVRIRGSGGAAVGAFDFMLPAGPEITWLNRDEINVVDRSQDLTLRWNSAGLDSTAVWISGGALDAVSDAKTQFSCWAAGSAGQFTVPNHVLRNLPAKRVRRTQSDASLGLAAVPASTVFSGPRLDAAFAVHYRWNTKSVEVR